MPKNRKKRNQTTGRNRGRSSVNHIPSFQANVRMKHRFRFIAIISGGYNITRANLLNLMVMGVGSNVAYRLFGAVKLNKIEMWNSGNAVGAPSTIALEWLSNLGPTTEISDTGNVFNWAHIVTSPPRTCLAGFWSQSGVNESEVLFSIQVQAGTTVDVWIEVVFGDGTGVNLTGYTQSGSASLLYYGALIGQGTGGSGNLNPVTVTGLY
jgi:hypothetical protein